MSRSSEPAVVCAGLSFEWPDGTPVLDGLDATLGTARTGLVGVNGSGKSTLLRLVAGLLVPTGGTVSVAGDVGYLPQDVALGNRPMAELLGIAGQLAALRAIEAGDASAANLAAVGDDWSGGSGWDVEERAIAELARFGLPTDLDRPVGTLSGGEAVLAGLVGLLVRRPAVTLLDEPTNNLDLASADHVAEALAGYRGALIVATHDRPFLDRIGVTTWWTL